MSLEIHVADAATPLAQLSSPSLSLENDGYYWALYPYFSHLSSLTGQGVDLYSDAVFDASILPTFRSALAKARLAYAGGPPTFAVPISMQLKPVRREVTETISRKTLLDLIQSLDALAQNAETLQRHLVFIGD